MAGGLAAVLCRCRRNFALATLVAGCRTTAPFLWSTLPAAIAAGFPGGDPLYRSSGAGKLPYSGSRSAGGQSGLCAIDHVLCFTAGPVRPVMFHAAA